MMENDDINPPRSEDGKVTIDTLLPPAKIHLFSTDQQTIDVFKSLEHDWRFGRINTEVAGNDLEEAIDHYARRKSPTLILIQTDNVDENFETKLATLAEYCDEGTAAIVIGPVNDIQLYRHLTNMGVSDYLVAPLPKETLIESIANSLDTIVGTVKSHLMAFIGVKGGVGTSSVATMTADLMEKSFNSKVLVIDAAGSQSTLWSLFGFPPSGTSVEATRAVADDDLDSMDRLIVKKKDNLHILNSGTENIFDAPVATPAYEKMLDYFLSVYPYVMVDLSGAPSQIRKMVLSRANSIAVVAQPRVPDLSIAKLMLKTIKEMPGGDHRKISIVINKSVSAKSDIGEKDIAEALDHEHILSLPFDASLFSASENSGEDLLQQKGLESYKSKLIMMLEDFTGEMYVDRDVQGKKDPGLLSLFKKVKDGDA